MAVARLPRRPPPFGRRPLHEHAMIAPARVAAYRILRAVSSGRADLPAAIAQARDRLATTRATAPSPPRSRPASVRWLATLDHLIGRARRRPVDRLDPEVVDILRLSAYQLLHLTRVPASAVVDDAVDLARRAGKKSASGFVNAVLRSLSRTNGTLPLPPRPDDAGRPRGGAVDYLSVSLSHPRWLVERWLDRFGFDATEQWLLFNNTPGAADAARQPPADHSSDACSARLEGLRRRGHARPLRARRADRRERPPRRRPRGRGGRLS